MKTLTSRISTFFGIILLAAIMVFFFAACPGTDDPGSNAPSIPSALQGTTWENANGDTITFTKKGVIINGETFTLKDRITISEINQTTLYFGDSQLNDFIVFLDGTISSVSLGGMQETGTWVLDDSGNSDGGKYVPVHTVTFLLNDWEGGDSEFEWTYVADGHRVGRPRTDPQWHGYTFTGWYSDAECTELFDFTQVINRNTNIYAGWYNDSGEFTSGDFTVKGDITLTITGYHGSGGDIIIPAEINGKPVTAIENRKNYWYEGVFAYKQLTGVIIPDSITSIGGGAFCSNQLTSVTIGNSVTTIGDGAFSDNQLTSIIIPDSVTFIGHDAFYSNQLTNVTIGNSVTSIGDLAFSNNQLTSVTIPDSVTSLSGFSGNQLTSIIIPNSVISIGDSAFYSNQLTSVTIPDSVTSIDKQAFASNQLISITIGANVTLYSLYLNSSSFGNGFEGVYGYDNGRSAGIYIRTDTTSSDWKLYYAPFTIRGDSELTIIDYLGDESDVAIPAKINGKPVTNIETSAFSDKNLTSVTIPDSVTFIGNWAFSNNQLTSVTIPDSVTSIENRAFANNQLTSVIIPNNVTSIREYAFSNNQLTSVTIGNSVTSIKERAFVDNQLTSVIIPNSVISIESQAFGGNQLTSITIGANVTLSNYPFGDAIYSLFEQAYNISQKAAGTYTRFNTSSSIWTKVEE